tara:strand:+ start:5421 stop:5687 length:267 start_codon:yes stop_codon:yes gene_type:complete
MEGRMLIDGISDVTLANGVVRIQLNTVNPDGTDAKVGTIEIPAAIVADVVNGLANSVNELNAKLIEVNEANQQTDSKKDSKNGKKKDK